MFLLLKKNGFFSSLALVSFRRTGVLFSLNHFFFCKSSASRSQSRAMKPWKREERKIDEKTEVHIQKYNCNYMMREIDWIVISYNLFFLVIINSDSQSLETVIPYLRPSNSNSSALSILLPPFTLSIINYKSIIIDMLH